RERAASGRRRGGAAVQPLERRGGHPAAGELPLEPGPRQGRGVDTPRRGAGPARRRPPDSLRRAHPGVPAVRRAASALGGADAGAPRLDGARAPERRPQTPGRLAIVGDAGPGARTRAPRGRVVSLACWLSPCPAPGPGWRRHRIAELLPIAEREAR